MMKKVLLGALVALCAASAFAGVELNKADQAALESVRGLGPADIAARFRDVRGRVLPAASRSVLAAGPAEFSIEAFPPVPSVPRSPVSSSGTAQTSRAP